MARAFKLGLTGGIGSGKSTVGQMLADLGATLIDADAISRSLTAEGGLAIPQIANTFGSQAVNAQGALDRDFMRQLVFQDPSARQRLEAIIHPLIGQVTNDQATLAESQGAQLLVFDIPLLVESDRWRPQLNAILVVDCAEETQIQRVMARNRLPRETITQIMAAQATRMQRKAAADWVIYNDGLNFTELREEVLSISAQLPL